MPNYDERTQSAPNTPTGHQPPGGAGRPGKRLDHDRPVGDPSEAGQRASIDSVTGKVGGSGSGTGGGNPGEDHDDDTAGSNPVTPVEDRDNVGTVKPEDYPDHQ